MRRDPAREECFTVVQSAADLHEFDDMSDIAKRQRLHHHMHNEIQNLEIVAQSLADFPEVSWDIRMKVARQVWDEGRHAELVLRRLRELGGDKGDHPVMNYEWGAVLMVDSMVGRMAVQNRTFEGGEMDLLKQQITMYNELGDTETSEMLAAILADEIEHVRYANRWLKQQTADDARTMFQIIAGVNMLKTITAAMAPDDGEVNAVGVNLVDAVHPDTETNVEDRLLAEFSEDEIAELLRREGFGPLVGGKSAGST